MSQPPYEPTTWYDPRLERRVSPTHGHGLFAAAPIRTGETVMIWGGDVYTEAELATVKLEGAWSYSIIDEGLLMFAPAENLDYFINPVRRGFRARRCLQAGSPLPTTLGA